MTAHWLDWLNLLLRWGHLITGIAWIGASFYFVWLDNSLEPASDDNEAKGFGGQLSSIHAGGFYEVAKYRSAPTLMPERLHWFKWEAYSTWLTGFLLFTLIYYVRADAYLLDPGKAALRPAAGIAISIGVLLGGWLIYDVLCKSALANNGWLLATVLLSLVTFAAWGLERIFSDRAAYLHVGALIGTVMAANVFLIIMPGQRALVAAVSAGQEPDPKYARASKLRSIHNNYLTLPVLFLMVSNHYPATYGHKYAWAILLALLMIGAWTRYFFNLRHKGIVRPGILISSAMGLALLIWFTAPASVSSRDDQADIPVPKATAMEIITTHCVTCHSATPTDSVFTVAPGGVTLDNEEQVRQWSERILARAVYSQDMPFMDKTGMTDQERHTLGRWLERP